MFFNNKKKEISTYINLLTFRVQKLKNKDQRIFLYATLVVLEEILNLLIVDKYNLSKEYLHENKSVQPLRDFRSQLNQQSINNIGNYIFLALISVIEHKIDFVLLLNKLNTDRKDFNRDISLFLELSSKDKDIINIMIQKSEIVNSEKFMVFYRWLLDLILKDLIQKSEKVASNASGVLWSTIDSNLNKLRVLILN